MPLIGLVDPSHDERQADEYGRAPKWMPVDEVMQRALESNPKWSPWTYEMVAAAMGEWQERDYVSVSMLTGGCARGSVIARMEPYVETLDSMYPALRGTMIHKALEAYAREGGLAEARFWAEVAGHEITCSPDLLTFGEEAAVWDYKTTENPPPFDYPYRSHTKQVQFNRYIVNHSLKWDLKGQDLLYDPRETQFQHCVLVYLGPKGPKIIENVKSVEYTFKNGNTGKRKMPYVWSDEEVLAELEPRLLLMLEALDSYPEWPQELEERGRDFGWQGPAGWKCPGPPVCKLPNCLAKRYPDGLEWPT